MHISDPIFTIQFRVGDKVVYPSYGMGEIVAIENREINNRQNIVYVISFPKDRLTLTLPERKASQLRSIVDESKIKEVYEILSIKAPSAKSNNKKNQIMDQNIRSGDIILIAEALRDLYRNNNQNKNQSYLKRTFYESALNKLAYEVSAVEQLDLEMAKTKILDILSGE